jgi:hypothetical protein
MIINTYNIFQNKESKHSALEKHLITKQEWNKNLFKKAEIKFLKWQFSSFINNYLKYKLIKYSNFGITEWIFLKQLFVTWKMLNFTFEDTYRLKVKKMKMEIYFLTMETKTKSRKLHLFQGKKIDVESCGMRQGRSLGMIKSSSSKRSINYKYT